MQESLTTPANLPGEISLRDYLSLLTRRRAIFIQTILVAVLVGAALGYRAKPSYRTSARILVEGKSSSLMQANADNPLSEIFIPDTGHDIATQIEVLHSDNVLAGAYKAANVPPGSVSLDVKQVGSTDVIELTMESLQADGVKRFADALPKTYLDYMTGKRRAEIKGALQFNTSRLNEENKKLNDAELALQEFKKRNHSPNVSAQRDQSINIAGQVEGEVGKAEGKVAGSQARLDLLQNARQSQQNFVEIPTTVTNQRIQLIKDQMAQLATEREKRLVYSKPNDVKVQEIDNQVAVLQKQLQEAPPTVTTTSRTPNPDLRLYDEKIADASAALVEAKAELVDTKARAAASYRGLNTFSTLERQEAQLQRAIERHRATVAFLSKSAESLSLYQQAIHDPLQIIAPATSITPIGAKKSSTLLYSLIIGSALGLGFALLQEFLDDRVHTQEEARRLIHAPALGHVPLVGKADARRLRAPQPDKMLESYRVLRANVQFAALDDPIHSLLVTSTMPHEGKSVTLANLAVASALDARRVIVVDTDLRQPTLHTIFNVAQENGLSDFLAGRISLEAALKPTSVDGLRILTSGTRPPNPAELLNSQTMRDLHTRLKEEAELIIYDSPPCLAAADAQLLAAETDAVLYVLQFGSVKRSAVRHAVELLHQARARVVGVVFNKISPSVWRDDCYYGYENNGRKSPLDALRRLRGRAGEDNLPATRSDVTSPAETSPQASVPVPFVAPPERAPSVPAQANDIPASDVVETYKQVAEISEVPVEPWEAQAVVAVPSSRPQASPLPVFLAGRLVGVDGPYEGQIFALTGSRTTFGRDASADINLKADTGISRYHGFFSHEGSVVRVNDTASTNGVYVNGERIEETALLQSGDIVQIGATTFRVE